ncbi:hypothetical protein G6F68_015778 [Rhizopus microsporus]|nr:hypothetical protein G6F68_015778 [Rhizopus microsporus]
MSIYLANGDNVQELAVKAGWLKVREGGKNMTENQEEILERLEQLQNEAQVAKVGMWSDAEKGVREVAFTFDRDPHTFLNKYMCH